MTGVLGCRAANLPLKYLGVPLGARYMGRCSWDPVIKIVERRHASWKRNFLSKGGRLTLVKSALSSIPIYQLSILKIPVNVAKKL